MAAAWIAPSRRAAVGALVRPAAIVRLGGAALKTDPVGFRADFGRHDIVTPVLQTFDWTKRLVAGAAAATG